MKIAYITTSFGCLSHTFIRREVVELRKLGLNISLFGIRPEAAKELSREDKLLVEQTVYLYPLKVMEIIFTNFKLIFDYPANYFKTFLDALFNEEINIFSHFKLIYHFFVSPYFAIEIQKMNIGHIHAHFSNVASTIAMYAARLSGISYSLTLHSAGERGLFSVIGLRGKIKYAKFLCCISQYNIDYFDEIFLCKNKTFLVHCGVDPDSYVSSVNHEYLLQNSKIHLISIGRLEEKKGFIYLIEACKILQEGGLDFKLTMIGDGPLLNELKKRAQDYSLSKDKILFLGSCPEAIVKEELDNSDICVIPSIEASSGEKEGIPVVIMEAMALGIPVIATRHSGIPEIVRDNETGLLVPEKDSLAIAKAIKLLTKDSNLRKGCIVNAKKIIQEEFNIKNIAKLKKRIFEENI